MPPNDNSSNSAMLLYSLYNSNFQQTPLWFPETWLPLQVTVFISLRWDKMQCRFSLIASHRGVSRRVPCPQKSRKKMNNFTKQYSGKCLYIYRCSLNIFYIRTTHSFMNIICIFKIGPEDLYITTYITIKFSSGFVVCSCFLSVFPRWNTTLQDNVFK